MPQGRCGSGRARHTSLNCCRMWFGGSHVALWHLGPTILEIQQEKPQGDVSSKQTTGSSSSVGGFLPGGAWAPLLEHPCAAPLSSLGSLLQPVRSARRGHGSISGFAAAKTNPASDAAPKGINSTGMCSGGRVSSQTPSWTLISLIALLLNSASSSVSLPPKRRAGFPAAGELVGIL